VNALLVVLALQAPIDTGTFVVRHDSVELARETFELRSIERGGSPAGWALASAARYEGGAAVTVALRLVVGTDSEPGSLEFDVASPQQPSRILGQASPGRFTVRTLGRRSEGAREYSLAGPTVVLDDSVFAPYLFVAWRARAGRSVTVTVLDLRAERRDPATVADLGIVATTLNRDPATLRHIVVTDGATKVDVWLDPTGRLMRVDVPARGLRIERVPPA
jgi:hypothetical protein